MSDDEATNCLDFGDECQVARDFYDAGRESVERILTDLITELRACPVLPTTREDLEPLRNMADRAEARLREVTDE